MLIHMSDAAHACTHGRHGPHAAAREGGREGRRDGGKRGRRDLPIAGAGVTFEGEAQADSLSNLGKGQLAHRPLICAPPLHILVAGRRWRSSGEREGKIVGRALGELLELRFKTLDVLVREGELCAFDG